MLQPRAHLRLKRPLCFLLLRICLRQSAGIGARAHVHSNVVAHASDVHLRTTSSQYTVLAAVSTNQLAAAVMRGHCDVAHQHRGLEVRSPQVPVQRDVAVAHLVLLHQPRVRQVLFTHERRRRVATWTHATPATRTTPRTSTRSTSTYGCSMRHGRGRNLIRERYSERLCTSALG
jgi:hypothetical protein